ncbi:hypothetical protein [Bacterioplanoides sp. SCSIO 12839]|uniref:hypothetical protein n=1 Tax=Bacterioplanoides sp. SCSIO 12839 TaxID=2829569 RepID=UPI0021056F91|nr:hypothetical protein [Bacterioplanoides sp. SCSIO 12839]UTW47475.1 hypothetical protein KFF03_12945 [Bacterioplanoides sp. SCSIO 12839]
MAIKQWEAVSLFLITGAFGLSQITMDDLVVVSSFGNSSPSSSVRLVEHDAQQQSTSYSSSRYSSSRYSSSLYNPSFDTHLPNYNHPAKTKAAATSDTTFYDHALAQKLVRAYINSGQRIETKHDLHLLLASILSGSEAQPSTAGDHPVARDNQVSLTLLSSLTDTLMSNEEKQQLVNQHIADLQTSPYIQAQMQLIADTLEHLPRSNTNHTLINHYQDLSQLALSEQPLNLPGDYWQQEYETAIQLQKQQLSVTADDFSNPHDFKRFKQLVSVAGITKTITRHTP